MWVARNKDNSLMAFNDKPIRTWIWEDMEHIEKKEYWCRDTDKYPPVHYGSKTALYDPNYQITFLDSKLFPDLKWEDEPIDVILDSKENLIKRLEILHINYYQESNKFFDDNPGKGFMSFDEYALKHWDNVDMNYFETIG